MVDSIAPAIATLPTLTQARPAKTEEAARQFEALLIGQMLRSVRESANEDEGSTGETMLDVADQQFSQLLANNGGLGLARMVVSALEKGAENTRR
jgi:flagellar protein FlgJ